MFWKILITISKLTLTLKRYIKMNTLSDMCFLYNSTAVLMVRSFVDN